MWECRASRDSSHLALCATLSCCDILVRVPPPCLSPLPPPRLAPPCRTVYLPVFTSKLATVHICQKRYPASSTSSSAAAAGGRWSLQGRALANSETFSCTAFFCHGARRLATHVSRPAAAATGRSGDYGRRRGREGQPVATAARARIGARLKHETAPT